MEDESSKALKLLLESKHLYQAVSEIPDDYFIPEFLRIGFPNENQRNFFRDHSQKHATMNWTVVDNQSGRMTPPQGTPEDAIGIQFTVPDVKLYCCVCDRTEAFNSISAEEFSRRGASTKMFGSPGIPIQVFVLSFLCQSCKSAPEVFLVRREGTKFKLCGRAPIEHVDVPKFIPKAVTKYYSGAIVAHQSGQTLAGLFLLRTLIEQWARNKYIALHPEKPEVPNLADQVIDAYMDSLPDGFNDRFPSLRELYEKLSADIHAATGSSKLFDESIEKIDRHFDARRVFKID